MNKDQRWAELVKIIATETDPEKVRHACKEIDRLAAMMQPQPVRSSEEPVAS